MLGGTPDEDLEAAALAQLRDRRSAQAVEALRWLTITAELSLRNKAARILGEIAAASLNDLQAEAYAPRPGFAERASARVAFAEQWLAEWVGILVDTALVVRRSLDGSNAVGSARTTRWRS